MLGSVLWRSALNGWRDTLKKRVGTINKCHLDMALDRNRAMRIYHLISAKLCTLNDYEMNLVKRTRSLIILRLDCLKARETLLPILPSTRGKSGRKKGSARP